LTVGRIRGAAFVRTQVAADKASESRTKAQKLTNTSQEPIERAHGLLRAKIVLLLEDDGAFRYAMSKMLRSAGAEVVESTTIEDAVTVLDQRPEIGAVVADVVLPDGLAPEGLKRFEQLRQLPVLYVTSFPDHLLRDYGLSARDPHLLMKPFDGDTLISRLAALGA
jgi:DNA-binding response OmpR family regulator